MLDIRLIGLLLFRLRLGKSLSKNRMRANIDGLAETSIAAPASIEYCIHGLRRHSKCLSAIHVTCRVWLGHLPFSWV